MNLKKRSEVKRVIYKDQVSESEPELILFEKLVQKGYRPTKQHKAHGYFLDLAFPEFKIGVEYDGKHHQYQVEKDQQRRKNLEAHGWKIFYIANIGGHRGLYQVTHAWGNDLGIFSDNESAMDALVKEVGWLLERYGFRNRNSRGFRSMAELLRTQFEKIEDVRSNM